MNQKPMTLGALLLLKLESQHLERHALMLTLARCTPNSIRARRGLDKSNRHLWLQERFLLTAKQLYKYLELDEQAVDHNAVSPDRPVFYSPKSPLPNGLRVYHNGHYVMFAHVVGGDNDQMDLVMSNAGYKCETIALCDIRHQRSDLLDLVLISSYQRLANVIDGEAALARGRIKQIRNLLSEEFGHP